MIITFKQFLDEEFNDEYYDELHNKLVRHFHYSNKESDHIHRYTDGTGSIDFNGKLHNIARAAQSGIKKYGPMHRLEPDEELHYKKMSKIVQKHTTPFSMHVYRGTTLGKAAQNTQHNAFTSTSLHPQQAMIFADPPSRDGYRHIWKIHIPKGSHAAYVAHHTNDYDFQKELVFHPGAKIEYNTKKPTITKNGLKVYHARLIHDGVKNVGD